MRPPRERERVVGIGNTEFYLKNPAPPGTPKPYWALWDKERKPQSAKKSSREGGQCARELYFKNPTPGTARGLFKERERESLARNLI